MAARLNVLLLLAALPLGCRGAASRACAAAGTQISAAAGGTLVVPFGEAGASLAIPPGALAQDTFVTLNCSDEAVGLPGTQAAGPALTIGPLEGDGTPLLLQLPAVLTLPFALPAGATLGQLVVVAASPGKHAIYLSSTLAIDATSGTLGLQVLALGTFGAVTAASCASVADCGPGSPQVCLAQVCSGTLGGEVAVGCATASACPGTTPCDAGVCVTGLFADGGSGSGASCATTSDCAPGLRCAGGVCVAS